MSQFSDLIGDLRTFTHDFYGDAAQWGSIAGVRVIKSSPDEIIPHGSLRGSVPTHILKVRVSDVASPAEGDIVVIDLERFRILGAPECDDKRSEWTCEAKRVP